MVILKHRTLTKTLCKWKQDSVVAIFLYLDSVFKNKHKWVHNPPSYAYYARIWSVQIVNACVHNLPTMIHKEKSTMI